MPALVLTAGLLTGCGPASIRSHLPSLPHVYLFQETSPVQTPSTALILDLTQLPNGFKIMGTTVLDNVAASKLAGSSPATAEAFTRWHRQDGAMVTYGLDQQASQSSPSSVAQVQVEMGRYATAQDAKGWFANGAAPPALADVHRLPDPGISPLNVAYQLTQPGVVAQVVYFQERNVVVRVSAIGPVNSPAIGAVLTFAQRERDLISAAK